MLLPHLIPIILLVSKASEAILVGEAHNKSAPQQLPRESESPETNATFYYEADTFLLNKNPRPINGSRQVQNAEGNNKFVPAAGTARNGRMLDLDSLMGDFAAAQANRERNPTGNRQSRFLSSPSLDVGNGKRLHIQGFIPIVGVKDVTGDKESTGQESDINQPAAELPYAQSSVGHATYGVQRYLNMDQPSQGQLSNLNQNQQVDAKFSGASVVESIKRPIKKLTGHSDLPAQQPPPSNCLCVPFYMCKNGFISESSLGKSQIQQMIQQQQQQQQQPPASLQQVEMKSGQLTVPPSSSSRPQWDSQPQPFNTNAYAAVDERSLDRDLGSAGGDNVTTADVQVSQTDQVDAIVQAMQMGELNSSQFPLDNVTTTDKNSGGQDFSQEILGRMLGIKSPNIQTKLSSGTNGVCGILRTCCQVPPQLVPSQQDVANDLLMAQYPQQQPLRQQYPPANRYPAQETVQATQAIQRYQQQQPLKQIPYGLPTSASQISTIVGQPASGVSRYELAHRSNQQYMASQPQMVALPPRALNSQHPQVAQFTRSAQPMQQLQSFQQPQMYPNLMKPVSQAMLQPVGNQQRDGLGTRKILEGRCGLRQSAGINGRVQNLQYHDSSADFGEYPAQAAILKRLGSTDSLFVCGGTLISQYWVATAAHCIKKHGQSDLKVRLGEWDVHRDDEFYPFIEKDVRDLVIHPEFVAGNLVNDIALLRLDSPVESNLPHVGPACLPTVDENFARQRCWVTGWGKDSFGQKGSFQSVLREVELPVVGAGECESALRQTRLGPHYRLHSGFICAGGEGGRDACEGDGGSGLYCLQPDGLIKVAGLVSWGIGCGQAGVPGVYVNMAHYRPWIENIISVDEDIYSPYANMISSNLISERSNQNRTETVSTTESMEEQATLQTSTTTMKPTTSGFT